MTTGQDDRGGDGGGPLKMDMGGDRPPLRLAVGADDHAHDALADLFLGDAERESDDSDAVRTRVVLEQESEAWSDIVTESAAEIGRESARGDARRVAGSVGPWLEVVVLGHLPVRAGLWVKQYALLRSGEVPGGVALVRVRGGELTVELVRAEIGESIPRDDWVGTIAGAGACVVHVDELDELAVASLTGVDAVTLLSGTNEAAVVGCYRAIRAMSQRDESMRFRVAWVGSQAGEAASAMDRLRETCEAFCSTPLEFAGVVERMGVARSVEIGGVDASLTLDALLQTVMARRERGAEMDLDPYPGEELDAGMRSDEREALIDSGTLRDERMETALPSAGGDGLGAATLGLVSLGIECPDAPSVELARDENGRLWLVSVSVGGGVGASVRGLVESRAWARKHAQLLGMASAGLIASDAVACLVTDRPREARALVGSDIEIHGAVEIALGERRVWASVAL